VTIESTPGSRPVTTVVPSIESTPGSRPATTVVPSIESTPSERVTDGLQYGQVESRFNTTELAEEVRTTGDAASHQLDEDTPCPPLDGKLELEQMTEFWKRMVNIDSSESRSVEELAKLYEAANPLVNYTKKELYEKLDSIQHVTENRATVVHQSSLAVRIRIEESRHGKLTKGGATFQTLINDPQLETRGSCSVADHFNGSYSVCCPVFKDVITIEVNLMYVNFSAYNSRARPTMNRPVFKETFHTGYKAPFVAKPGIDLSGEGHWELVDNDWKWVLDKTGQPVPFLNHSHVHQCLTDRYPGGHTLVGDSHVRYLHQYLADETYPTIGYDKKKFSGHHQVGNAYYMPNYYAPSLLDSLLATRKHKTSYLKTPLDKTFTVIDCGTHDFAFLNISGYIYHMDIFFKELKKLQNCCSDQYQEIFHNPIFFLTMPAFPSDHVRHKGASTNMAAAAANHWVKGRLQEVDIVAVDLL